MSPSIYPSIRGSASQNKASPFDRSSNRFFFGLGTLIKNKTYIIYIYIYMYYIYIYMYLYIYIYISIYAADIGGLWNLILGSLVIEFYL